MSGIKPENSFSALSPLSPTVGCFAPHSHPSPPEEKAASRRKSRLRRKKTAPVGVAWVAAWGGALRGGRKILRPYKWKSGYRRYRCYRCYRLYRGCGLLGMWAWWDGGDKKVGFAEEKLRLWGLAWAKRGARQKIV